MFPVLSAELFMECFGHSRDFYSVVCRVPPIINDILCYIFEKHVNAIQIKILFGVAKSAAAANENIKINTAFLF